MTSPSVDGADGRGGPTPPSRSRGRGGRILRPDPVFDTGGRPALLLALCLAFVSPLATASDAQVDQPRPFGHAIGDVLTQRILLVEDGRPFEPAALPGPARLGVWFERRGARIERTDDGRRWLAVDYQVVNAPQALATIRLPAWELAGSNGAAPLRVAAWSVAVAPLAPPATAASAGSPALRPDRPAPAIATAPLERRLAAAALALVACLAAWGAWLGWRAWQAARTQPFARALHALRGEAGEGPAAWRTLHEAFDRTAGEVARPATLPRLFERAPHLRPLQARIERFFAQSQARFFGDAPAGPTSGDAESPRALCHALRRLERGAER
jgi:mxaA protein